MNTFNTILYIMWSIRIYIGIYRFDCVFVFYKSLFYQDSHTCTLCSFYILIYPYNMCRVFKGNLSMNIFSVNIKLNAKVKTYRTLSGNFGDYGRGWAGSCRGGSLLRDAFRWTLHSPTIFTNLQGIDGMYR